MSIPLATWPTASLLFFLSTSSLYAQAIIDPKLPMGSEPLLKRRIVGILADYGSVAKRDRVAALSTKQKFQLFAGETFDPGVLLSAAALAGFGYAFSLAPEYGHGWEPYSQRLGAISANLATSTLFSEALLPTAFHQDPRYFKKGVGSFKSRFWYAVSQTFITRNDDGSTGINYSQICSVVGSTAMTNLYYPDKNRTAGQNAARASIGFSVSALLNVVREFAPERFTGK
jgi:hypothetical protein